MRRISKSDLCSSCLQTRYKMDNGSLSMTAAEVIDCAGYQEPTIGVMMGNTSLRMCLREGGGCSSCKSVVERAMR
jgi:hypothetical protein